MYAGGAASDYKDSSLGFLKRVAQGQTAGVTSAEVLQALLHRYLTSKDRKAGFAVYDTFRKVVHEVFSVDAEDVDRGRELAEKYPKSRARDLLHLAVMINRDVKTIASWDTDFDDFKEITRIDPSFRTS
jgi:predicted nucleic acid-binding protein